MSPGWAKNRMPLKSSFPCKSLASTSPVKRRLRKCSGFSSKVLLSTGSHLRSKAEARGLMTSGGHCHDEARTDPGLHRSKSFHQMAKALGAITLVGVTALSPRERTPEGYVGTLDKALDKFC